MPAADLQSSPEARTPAQFTTTHWSVVLAAGPEPSSRAALAMERLCRTYWYPLYAYVRSKGHSPEEAEDLTQEFFARLLQKNPLAQLDRSKGRFRAWLLAVMNHFLAHEWEKARAQKRGGGAAVIPLDEAIAEKRFQQDFAKPSEPEKLFDRRWALTVLEQAAARLRAAYVAEGRPELYERLKGFVSAETATPSYAEAAAQLGLSEAAVRSAIHRLRRRFQELVREEIAHTVSTPAEVDEELRYLISIIRS
jgi:RNA polymerase sigma-70 factor (ECF subfamily)